MTDTQISRHKQNKDKNLYRMLFAITVICLIIYFWLDFSKAIEMTTARTIAGYLFLIGLAGTLGFLLRKEKEPGQEPRTITPTEVPPSGMDT